MNARTWTTYQQASASTAGDGLGFALDGDGIVCIDLDNCIEQGRLTQWASDILEQLPRTYIEVSPSGHGLHVWGTGRLRRGRVVSVDGHKVELYGHGRYLTVTGRRFRSAPSRLADISATLTALIA